MPPLHIKLDSIKILLQDGEGFKYIHKFLALSDKVEEGVFVIPDIRNLVKDKHFENTVILKKRCI